MYFWQLYASWDKEGQKTIAGSAQFSDISSKSISKSIRDSKQPCSFY